MNAEALIGALRAAGCQPRQIGDGLWLAACPSCRARGHFGLLEVQVTPEGVHMDCDPNREPQP